MSSKQKTIAKNITISGTGLHSGEKVTLTFKPAEENFGIKFQRIDLEDKPIIPALIENVTDISRGTTISKGKACVSTIEHVLAALTGLEIDNILIEIDNIETPIMDGSSKIYTEAFRKAGIIEQNAEKNYYILKKTLTYTNKEKGIEIIAIPSDEYKLSVMIDYKSEVIGMQYAQLNDIKDFEQVIAPCRTFVFLHELEYLLAHNLIKGGDLNNAIVIVDKEISQDELNRLAKVFNKPSVNVINKGILNNTELVFENELARHKLLDIIGDITLCGFPIKAHIIAKCPGHAANIEFTKLLKEEIKKELSQENIPTYDPNQPPIYDINDIKKLLPHRPPFLLVDKIISMDENHIVGIKNVTMNETFFVGHFPHEPVMPGVLQIEAMAQAGGIYTLSKVEDPDNYTTYFIKIDNVKFKNKVIPGDTLIFRLEPATPFRRGICHMNGKAYVGNKLVMEAELMAQIVKNKN